MDERVPIEGFPCAKLRDNRSHSRFKIQTEAETSQPRLRRKCEIGNLLKFVFANPYPKHLEGDGSLIAQG
jgi:hypothetical protein